MKMDQIEPTEYDFERANAFSHEFAENAAYFLSCIDETQKTAYHVAPVN